MANAAAQFVVGERSASWSAAFAQALEQTEVMQPIGAASDAEIHTYPLGPLRLVHLRCDRSTIRRSDRDAPHGSECAFTIVLLMHGSGGFKHYGHHIGLEEGDFTLCDNSAPYTLDLSEDSEALLIRVPASLLKEHLPSPNHFCGRVLAADQSLAATVSAMAASLLRQLEEGLGADCGERAARHLLGMIASCYASAIDQVATASSIMAARHWNVKLYIEQHLRDPDLSPSTIARALKLSSRYLRMIFATSNESLSAYILRRRLEECARRLTDPRWRGHSITEIAFSWGFNSAPHFTRTFRERFKLSPRDYRQREVAPAPLAMPVRRAAPALAAVAA